MAQQQPTGIAGLDEDKMKLVQDLEIEMMTDMYSRLSTACQKKVMFFIHVHFAKRKKRLNFLYCYILIYVLMRLYNFQDIPSRI